MNAPFKTDALPEWRLDDLYAGREDPRIETDLAEAARVNSELAAMKGQFVAARADAPLLGERLDRGIQLYEDATNGLWRVGAFASLEEHLRSAPHHQAEREAFARAARPASHDRDVSMLAVRLRDVLARHASRISPPG